jgi:hypothetical protein
MYKMPSAQMTFDDFILPFSGSLDPDNRWIKLSKLIPWEAIEKKYAQQFSHTGQPAKPLRMALGALIIKERCGFSDEETVEQIKENPYLQYFIGQKEYQREAPFDPSMMVWFRKRLSAQTIREINKLIFEAEKPGKKDHDDQDQPPGAGNTGTQEDAKSDTARAKGNRGTLILDATCAPSDIKYPTDLGLLNEAREKLEAMVDTLHEPWAGRRNKPRTYRIKARKDYLTVAKQKQPGIKKIRRAIGKQLRYVGRDLAIVKAMIAEHGEERLSRKQVRELEVIQKLYEQQKNMYRNRKHRIEDRIVSISQPYVRPIVRGKAKANTEFGAKVAIRLWNGYSFTEKLSWNNYNEGNTLIATVEEHKRQHGCYPEAILADKLYRTRENLQYCKTHSIRLSGPKLGRPTKIEDKAQKRLERQDASERNAVEGKFGEGKRRYNLDRIMAKLQETSETVIELQFLVMNLERKLRILLSLFLRWLFADLNPAIA